MSSRLFARSVAVAAILGAAVAQAQTTRLTDVPPAEERDSAGAVVLENSLVRAQRDKAFEQSSGRTGVGSVGRGVVRATGRAQTQAELAQARAAHAADLHRRGAAALTGN